MIRLIANHSTEQVFYVTPFNDRKDLSESITHYLIVFEQTESVLAFVANVAVDNERYTEVNITTNVDAPTLGNVKIEDTGLYRYTIYGQTSSTNLSPSNAAVKGVLETGSVEAVSSDSVAVQPLISIPGYIYYRE